MSVGYGWGGGYVSAYAPAYYPSYYYAPAYYAPAYYSDYYYPSYYPSASVVYYGSGYYGGGYRHGYRGGYYGYRDHGYHGGYRGHDYKGSASVMVAGNRRGLTLTMGRELKRRSGHQTHHRAYEGRWQPDRNFLLGHVGDAINALLMAAGHNLRLILAKLAFRRAFFLAIINLFMAKADTSSHRPTAKRSMG